MEIKERPVLNHNPKRWDNFFLKCVGVDLPENEEAEIRQLVDESIEADVQDLNDDSVLY